MKKLVMIAVIATVCFTGISLIAGTTEDKTVKTEKKTESVVSEKGKDNSGPGPSVALNKEARDGWGNSISLNIYYATNQCNAYVAYETDDKEFARPMAVRECRGCSRYGNYFVEKGERYFFKL